MNHDTAIEADSNLAVWCQRCHIVHGWPEHIRRESVIYLHRRAGGDLFVCRNPLG